MKSKRSILAFSVIIGLLITVPAMAQDTASAPPAQPLPEQQGVSIDRHERAEEILHQMLPPDIATGMASKSSTASFGSDMSRLAFENAYVQLWTRPGLSLKERSLVTISILIAQGNARELAVHLASGLRNGLTPEEIEEVIYHSTAYAGFPRASDALATAKEVIAQERKEARE